MSFSDPKFIIPPQPRYEHVKEALGKIAYLLDTDAKAKIYNTGYFQLGSDNDTFKIASELRREFLLEIGRSLERMYEHAYFEGFKDSTPKVTSAIKQVIEVNVELPKF